MNFSKTILKVAAFGVLCSLCLSSTAQARGPRRSGGGGGGSGGNFRSFGGNQQPGSGVFAGAGSGGGFNGGGFNSGGGFKRSFGGNQQPGGGVFTPGGGGPVVKPFSGNQQPGGGGFTPGGSWASSGWGQPSLSGLHASRYEPHDDYSPTSSYGAYGTIRISMPAGVHGRVAYKLNAYPYYMGPGQSQSFYAEREWVIRFDRGGGYGWGSYTLSPGSYVFRKTGHGWELFSGNHSDGGFASTW